MRNGNQVVYADSPRVGKFNILREELNHPDNRPILEGLFQLMTLLEKVPHESGRGWTFVCASPLFDAIEVGAEVPEYRLVWKPAHEPFDDPIQQKRRIENRGFGYCAIRNTIIRVPPITVAVRGNAPLH